MKLNQKAKLISELTIVTYILDCPYCLKLSKYRFEDSCLPISCKCKYCKEQFLVNYSFYEDEGYQNIIVLKCKSCSSYINYADIKMRNDRCDCGSIIFETIPIDTNSNELPYKWID
jgi:hypothetical protein